MVEEKRDILLEEGVPVTVRDFKTGTDFNTTVLVGKATKQFFSEISLESHRQGQFLPDVHIRNGLIVRNNVTDEDYIIVANYPEIIEQQKSATIVRMIVCNATISVSKIKETADINGNLRKGFVPVYRNMPVYIELIDKKAHSTNPGKFYEGIYRIYAPDIELDYTDRVELSVGRHKEFLKFVGFDYLTFDGVVLMDVITDTRKS